MVQGKKVHLIFSCYNLQSNLSTLKRHTHLDQGEYVKILKFESAKYDIKIKCLSLVRNA